MKKPIFILGAPDLEMNVIENILKAIGVDYLFASPDGVKRVTALNAYSEGLRFIPGHSGGNTVPVSNTPQEPLWIMVECGGYDITGGVLKIDHHYPGDSGYDKDHFQHWEGSSIGQVSTLLQSLGYVWYWQSITGGVDPRIISASDHYPAHAIKGWVPDVSPKDLIDFRVSMLSAKYSVPSSEIMRRLKRNVRAIHRHFPTRKLGGELLYMVPSNNRLDMLTDSAFLACVPVEVKYPCKVTGAARISLISCTSEIGVRTWMEEMQDKVTGLYGNPLRGYAGGYLKGE